MTEPFIMAIAVLVLCTIAAAALWNRRTRGDQVSEPGAPPIDTRPKCQVCGEPATLAKPKTIYRKWDYATDTHAERSYGMPPKPIIETHDGKPVLCDEHHETSVHLLEQFQAKQYARHCNLAADQAAEAAEFEAVGMIAEARRIAGFGEE